MMHEGNGGWAYYPAHIDPRLGMCRDGVECGDTRFAIARMYMPASYIASGPCSRMDCAKMPMRAPRETSGVSGGVHGRGRAACSHGSQKVLSITFFRKSNATTTYCLLSSLPCLFRLVHPVGRERSFPLKVANVRRPGIVTSASFSSAHQGAPTSLGTTAMPRASSHMSLIHVGNSSGSGGHT